jgi:hypothetical protein
LLLLLWSGRGLVEVGGASDAGDAGEHCGAAFE